jgi:hypothetical protein
MSTRVAGEYYKSPREVREMFWLPDCLLRKSGVIADARESR